jgi:hypothetical protein
MWSGRNVKLQILLLCAALCAPCGLSAQALPASPIEADAPRAQAPEYYAIIGGVVRPGVYRLPPSGVQLVRLVQLAGGLSDRASGAIRLIRNDRAGQQTYYSPDLQFELLPGDVLIVDEQPSAVAEGLQQVALLHLLHRPVVVSVPSESASLRGLFGLLGQGQNPRLLVRLLIPGQGDRVYRADNADGVILESCAVVMFAPESVDILQAPLLPRAVNEPPDTSPIVATVGEETAAGRPKLTQIPPPEHTELRVANVSDVVRDSSPIDIPDALPLPESRIEAPAPPRVRHASQLDDVQPVANSPRPVHGASKSSRDTQAAGGSMLFLLMVVATVGGVLTAAGWLIWRDMRSHGLKKAVVVKKEESRLETLIRNELPVVTERLAWPPDVPLYGRSESVRLRYDAAHQRADASPDIPSPHMPLETARPREAVTASSRPTRSAPVAVSAPAERMAPAARPESQLRVDTPQPAAEPARKPQRAGVLERVLMRMQESSR